MINLKSIRYNNFFSAKMENPEDIIMIENIPWMSDEYKRETSTDIVFYRQRENSVIVIGELDKNTEAIIPLSERNREIAEKRGFDIIPDGYQIKG